MRLINAMLLEIETFHDESHMPPYAILSHTWGGEELSLEQFRDVRQYDHRTSAQVCDDNESSRGYWKILQTCQQALDDGLLYAWVDTCCIDKTSSAELSEAINSMFRWYHNLTMCYVYLEDMKARPVPMSSREGTEATYIDEESLAQSRWFTRGWTLQELIAPKTVKFYD